ncbi:MAG: hypothetical protein M1814_002659 [Vezdaea aestivalis]|nr:MAG: hypothetical protein M1814_002659 [Vezdaea aestivalis]
MAPRPKDPMTRSGPSKSKTKPAAKKPATPNSDGTKISTGEASKPNIQKLAEQQRILDIFRKAVATRHGNDNFTSLLQQVKQYLYNRDFAAAFGKPEFLDVYAARWSPSRALAYFDIFSELFDRLVPLQHDIPHDEDGKFRFNVVGGGAGAEFIALSALFHHTLFSACQLGQGMKIGITDMANWFDVVMSLSNQDSTEAPNELLRHTLGPGDLTNDSNWTYDRTDVLAWDAAFCRNWAREVTLATFMFTLNELYTTSISKTTALLLAIAKGASPGTVLLVVDSPGSYSTLKLGHEEKRYPMQWLLDLALLETANDESSPYHWEKIASTESCWFRLPPGLKYPIELENMRYQMHTYQLKKRKGGN